MFKIFLSACAFNAPEERHVSRREKIYPDSHSKLQRRDMLVEEKKNTKQQAPEESHVCYEFSDKTEFNNRLITLKSTRRFWEEKILKKIFSSYRHTIPIAMPLLRTLM